MSITVWVAEEILDHEPGWVRGVFSTRELAIESVVSENRQVYWNMIYFNDGSVDVYYATMDTGRKVHIAPHVIDSPTSQ